MVTKQIMCEKCQGMKKLFIDGKEISPFKWITYGFASDIGCICIITSIKKARTARAIKQMGY